MSLGVKRLAPPACPEGKVFLPDVHFYRTRRADVRGQTSPVAFAVHRNDFPAVAANSTAPSNLTKVHLKEQPKSLIPLRVF